MLYYNPPFLKIDSIVVFPDHADPHQYYYIASQPRLSFDQDGKPVFSILKYVEDAPEHPKDGMFLNLQVDTGLTQNQLDSLRENLASQVKPPPGKELKLAPVPLTDGEVKMILFDSSATGGDKSNKMVQTISQAAKPALFANNQAIFSVSLSPTGAQLIWESLEGKISPIGICYTLNFNALKPAYKVKVVANWDEIKERLKKNSDINAIVYSKDIQELVENFTKVGLLKIEGDTYVSEEEGKGAIASKENFMTQLTDMVTHKFMEPHLNPDPKKDEPSGIEGTLNGIGDLFSRFRVGYQYSEEKAKTVSTSTLAAEATERITVQRAAYPQAYLTGLLESLGGKRDAETNYVQAVRLDDDFFKRRSVQVISRADFKKNSIASINVNLTYGDKPQSVTLEKQEDKQSVSWLSQLNSNNKMEMGVKVKYTVNFNEDELLGQRPGSLSHEVSDFTGNNYEIFPYNDLFVVKDIPVEASATFPWDRYPQVDVDIENKYKKDKNEEIKIPQNLSLKDEKEGKKKSFRLFVMPPTDFQYNYTVTYRGNPASDLPDVKRTFEKIKDEQIEIRDPNPKTLKLTFYADDIKWENVKRVIVDLTYKDDQNKLELPEKLKFEKPKKEEGIAPKIISFHIVNRELRKFEYKITTQCNDGIKRTEGETELEDIFLANTDTDLAVKVQKIKSD